MSDETQTRNSSPEDCCIVGGGPAGMILGLLLARVGLKGDLARKPAGL